MKTDNTDNMMLEELAEAKNATEKQQILMKYGMIEPKLNVEEKMHIRMEQFPFLRSVSYE